MTVREKLELLAQSEDRNAAVIAAYEEGVTTGIAAAVAMFDISVENATLLSALAGANARGVLDAPCNEDLEDEQ